LSTPPPPLPPAFLAHLAALESTYLRESDPIKHSGFNGGRERWRAERAPILDAIPTSGNLLDIGCANGHLLECLLKWGAERALALTPFGIDYGAGLVALARERLPHFRDHFWVANAALGAFAEQLMDNVVAPGGRLILGAYGSRSRREPPAPIDAMLTDMGYAVAGSTQAGTPETARFAWIDKR
jgi:SAM-dependent methyltransferase